MQENFCLNPFICTRQNAYNRISPCAFGPVEVQVEATDNQQARWQHPAIQELRQKFSQGDRPVECKRCWDEEAAAGQSLRLRTFDYHPTAYQDLIETGLWKQGPKEIVIKTSNVCNLACRSCAGWDTSFYWPEGQHYADTYNTQDPKWGKYNHFMQSRPKMYHPAESWTDQDLANVEKINFFGGEPLLDREHPAMLQRLVDSGRSKQVTLFYSTNCQQSAGRKLIELWKQFKRIEIFFSVDGMGEQFEYLRWPGKWSRTQRVIDWFLALPQSFPNVDWYFRGSQCVSLFNIASYWQTAEWLRNKLGGVYFNIVDHPNYLRMTALPDAAKQQISKQIPDDHIRQYLFIEPSNPEHLRQFVIWCKRQDLYRKQDFVKTFPETHALIADVWQKYNATDT
jgi:hypothetical protein